MQVRPTSNLPAYGGKSIGTNFMQIAQAIQRLCACFDWPTQRGQTRARIWDMCLDQDRSVAIQTPVISYSAEQDVQ